jgi:hypothetical protein
MSPVYKELLASCMDDQVALLEAMAARGLREPQVGPEDVVAEATGRVIAQAQFCWPDGRIVLVAAMTDQEARALGRARYTGIECQGVAPEAVAEAVHRALAEGPPATAGDAASEGLPHRDRPTHSAPAATRKVSPSKRKA